MTYQRRGFQSVFVCHSTRGITTNHVPRAQEPYTHFASTTDSTSSSNASMEALREDPKGGLVKGGGRGTD